jgi:hypothetical protein
MLSTTEFVTLIGREYAWFESKRRRAREALDMSKPIAPGASFPTVDTEALILPVKDITGGRWAKYDAEDALTMAVAVEGEKRGLTFDAAAKLSENASAVSVLSRDPKEPDLWIGKIIDPDGATHHVAESWERISKVVADEAPALDLVFINASAVLRALKQRANDLGLSDALGW